MEFCSLFMLFFCVIKYIRIYIYIFISLLLSGVEVHKTSIHIQYSQAFPKMLITVKYVNDIPTATKHVVEQMIQHTSDTNNFSYV